MMYRVIIVIAAVYGSVFSEDTWVAGLPVSEILRNAEIESQSWLSDVHSDAVISLGTGSVREGGNIRITSVSNISVHGHVESSLAVTIAGRDLARIGLAMTVGMTNYDMLANDSVLCEGLFVINKTGGGMACIPFSFTMQATNNFQEPVYSNLKVSSESILMYSQP